MNRRRDGLSWTHRSARASRSRGARAGSGGTAATSSHCFPHTCAVSLYVNTQSERESSGLDARKRRSEVTEGRDRGRAAAALPAPRSGASAGFISSAATGCAPTGVRGTPLAPRGAQGPARRQLRPLGKVFVSTYTELPRPPRNAHSNKHITHQFPLSVFR